MNVVVLSGLLLSLLLCQLPGGVMTVWLHGKKTHTHSHADANSRHVSQNKQTWSESVLQILFSCPSSSLFSQKWFSYGLRINAIPKERMRIEGLMLESVPSHVWPPQVHLDAVMVLFSLCVVQQIPNVHQECSCLSQWHRKNKQWRREPVKPDWKNN